MRLLRIGAVITVAVVTLFLIDPVRAVTSTAVSCDALQPIIAACSAPTPALVCPAVPFTTGAVYCVSPNGAIMGAVKPGTSAIVLEVWTAGALTKSVPVVMSSPGGAFYQQLDPAMEGSARVIKGYTVGADGTRTAFDANVCKAIGTFQSCLPGFPFTWK